MYREAELRRGAVTISKVAVLNSVAESCSVLAVYSAVTSCKGMAKFCAVVCRRCNVQRCIGMVVHGQAPLRVGKVGHGLFRNVWVLIS